MAQSGSFYDDIKKEIECAVCQEQFSESNEPKVLHCQHTFCKSCLESWLRQHHGGALTCPNCRQRTECPNNNIDCLPSNLTYKNLIDILKTHSKNGEHGITFCERHKEKVKFYCEQCEICICSHCAILDHRNQNSHSIISLEEGVKKEKANIERKMRQLSAKSSRLNSYASILEKRRALVNRSIEQATKEVHRVAQSCINSIRQHESSVTELLKTQKSSCNDEYSKELSKLTEKRQRMKNVSAQSTNAIQQNNLQEILNIKHVLDERIGEDVLPVLNYPEFKYISDDALYLNSAPGQLYVTNTEPSLSVASGNGLTKGTQGKEGAFTVTTNDLKGHATYSEIDNVRVEMKSNQKGTEDIRSVVGDWKNGHYSIRYTPKVAGKFSVSIKVREEPIKGSPFTLTVTKATAVPGGVPVLVPNYWTVQPKDSQGIQVPNYWTVQPKDPQGNATTVHLYQLDSSKDVQEYQNVQARFQKTCRNPIVKIERVQNPVLYRTYAIRKQKMEEGKGSNEQWLFHGTPGVKRQLVNHTGFNRSFHGKNGTVYGNGVYFALYASYSARSTYSPPDGSGFRYMYLTRVLVGEYTDGRQGLLTPPSRNPNDPTDTYDSVVDQTANPRIFVVFYDWQSYPEYLITFQ